MVMITVIGKRTETAWISDFFDPKRQKKTEIVIDKKTGTETKNWVQS